MALLQLKRKKTVNHDQRQDFADAINHILTVTEKAKYVTIQMWSPPLAKLRLKEYFDLTAAADTLWSTIFFVRQSKTIKMYAHPMCGNFTYSMSVPQI